MPLSREVPFSLLLHAIIVAGFVVLGGQVAKPLPDTRRIFNVRLASLPEPETKTQVAATEVETPAEKPQQKPPDPVELEPKTVPDPPRQEPEEKPEPRREAKPTQPREEVTTPDPVSDDAAAETGAKVATTVDFPFVYYVDLIERRVSRNWHPPPLDSYRGTARACLVQFVVGRGGEVTRVSLAASSGVSFFDREALAAVKSASPLPPLPAKFPGPELPVTIRFTLKPGY